MKKKILIGIPTAKYIESSTFKSIYDLEIPEGYETTFQFFYGYDVAQVRNLIADWTIKGFDYLFAVDHDIILPKDSLKKMLSHDVDIVSGVYRQRMQEQHIEIYDVNLSRMKYENLNTNSLTKIGGCGFGCVLIKSEVFKKIEYPHFYYKHALNHENTFSEDLYFCREATKTGSEIYVDSSILCRHIGTTEFVVDTTFSSNSSSRLEELKNQKLLPESHIKYLNEMSHTISSPKVIYDIGSCVLHWTSEARKVWPNSKFILFEAMNEVKEIYENEGYSYHLGVLGDRDNVEVEFYQNTEHPGGNSIFKENPLYSPRAEELFPEDKKIKKIMMTLDTVVESNKFPLPNIIKMDIQGAELMVLKGASQTLKSCSDIIIEMQHVDYNIGAPKTNEIINYLNSIGFTLVGNKMFSGSALAVDGDYHFTRI